MAIIYETKNFILESHEKPHVDRNHGGHIKITPKIKVKNRQDLEPLQAIELMRFISISGEAMMFVMKKNGVDIGRINYQDNGNWSVFSKEGPHLHIHLYGRAKDAKTHIYGEACVFPHIKTNPEFYKDFKSLNEKDILDINLKIKELFKEEKYSDKSWNL